MTDAGLPPVAPEAPLTLTTLGGASLVAADTPLLTPGKPFAMLTYLALAPGHAASREFLLDLLWADLDPTRGRHALRQTVWLLRRQLGDGAITGGEELALARVIGSDRDDFLAAIEAGDPERAVRLYRGEFLPGLTMPGAQEFEHWADVERSRLRATFLRAAEMTARRAQAAGRFREVQAIARRMREADLHHEGAWRLLLEGLLAGGDLIQAAVEAETLNGVLTADARDPEPSTAAVLETVRQGLGRAPRPEDAAHGLVAELVGREREFAAILDAWARVRGGASAHLHLVGHAGLGKTRLLQDLERRLRSTGARVLSVRANPGDRTVAFATIGDLATKLGPMPGLAGIAPATADVLVSLSPSLSSRFPNARISPPNAESIRLRTAALEEALAAVADEKPVALLIDDAHWLDAESFQVLDGMVGRLDHARILVVHASRPGLGRPLAAARSDEIGLEPLSPGAVRDLLTSLGQMGDEQQLAVLAERLQRSTGGSPLLVLEALKLALDRGTLALEDGVWTVLDPAGLMDQLDAGNALRSRLADLPADTAWTLLLLATIGSPLSTSEIAQAVRARDGLDEQLWTLEHRGFLRREHGSWRPAHDEIAECARALASPERRRAAHAAAARVLAAEGQPSLDALGRAGRHLEQAADWPGLERLFRQIVTRARSTGDQRSLADLAATVVSSREDAHRLVRSLPTLVRVGLHSGRRVALVGILALVALATLLALRSFAGSEVVTDLMVLAKSSSGGVEVRRVRLDRRGWRPGRALQVDDWRSPVVDPVLAGFSGGAGVVAIDGRWVFTKSVNDSLTDEIFVSDGRTARLVASAPRDDVHPSLSPDGRWVAFLTARWSAVGGDDYDIAIAPLLRPDSVRRVTGTDDFDLIPTWAPHGRLIAFGRRSRRLEPSQACWLTPFRLSSEAHCVPAPVGEVVEVAGWLEDGRVLVVARQGDTGFLLRWNLVDDNFQTLYQGAIASARSSPDGRWILCQCARDATEPTQHLLFPSDDPGAARPAVEGAEWLAHAWRSSPPAVDPLQARIQVRELAIPVGAAHLVGVAVLDRDGDRRLFPAGAVEWRSSDSTTLQVDHGGTLAGRRIGAAWLYARFGEAWDSIEVRITADTSTAVLDEDWRTLDSTRWMPFGDPRPRLVVGSDGIQGLNNGGDGKYISGVFGGDTLSGSLGIGVEAMVSAKVTRPQWQAQSVAIMSTRNRDITGWDRVSGSPGRTQVGSEFCAAGYPAGEGLAAIREVYLHGPGPGRRLPVGEGWSRGDWHRVTVQLFPDGSCGYAVDGRAVWRTRTQASPAVHYRIWLAGNSAGTDQIRVGRVEAWLGVRQHVDWSAVGRAK